MEEESVADAPHPRTGGTPVSDELNSRLNAPLARRLVWGGAVGGSIWFWWYAIRAIFGYSFLASLSPDLAPAMVFALIVGAIGVASAVFILIAGYRKNLSVGYSLLYFAVAAVTWLIIAYGTDHIVMSLLG
jgi:hypothetical protein